MPPLGILYQVLTNPQPVALDITITSIRALILFLVYHPGLMNVLITPGDSSIFSDQVLEAYPCGTSPSCMFSPSHRPPFLCFNPSLTKTRFGSG